jgi:hypothetical protein
MYMYVTGAFMSKVKSPVRLGAQLQMSSVCQSVCKQKEISLCPNGFS